MNRNIFEKILNVEDDYTNLFCNLLCNRKYEKIFEECLQIENIKGKKVVSIETNEAVASGSKPDAVIKFEDNITVLIENKISTWRDLTENQPNTYLNYLQEIEGNKYFVLLIPLGYLHLLEFKKRYNTWEKHRNIQIPLVIIYWQDIYKILKEYEDDQVLQDFANEIDLENMEEEVKMTDEELNLLENDFIYKYDIKIKEIIDYAHSGLLRKEISCDRCDDDGENDYGYYVKDSTGNILFWFGKWEEVNRRGYLLSLGANIQFHKYAKIFKKNNFLTLDDQYYIPFCKKDITDKNNIGESYLRFILKQYELGVKGN